jgi:hypothetical protein
MSRISSLFSSQKPKLHRLAEFFLKQGVTLAANLLYGLLAVRLLTKADYAMFAVLFAYQGSIVVLMDIGISGSLVPLVGERTNDLQLIADYVASLRQMAHKLYGVMAVATCFVFPYLVRKQGWSAVAVAAMVGTLLISSWFARVSAAYGSVLILRRDRAQYYRAQMGASVGTLLLLLLFWALHLLNSATAIAINVTGILFCAASYYRRAQVLLGTEGVGSTAKQKAIVHLALPNLPNVIFYAVQGQISLMLITVFGRTNAVAGVGALGRLGQIFVIFSQMNPLLVEPFFAKLAASKLKPAYLTVASLVAAACCALSALAWFEPGIFLWLLGPKYSEYRYEVFLAVASGAIRYFSSVLWVINSARKFIYYWNNMATIILTILVQAVFLWKTDMGSVRSVLLFNVVSAVASLGVNILCVFYGFWKGPRKVKEA